MWTSIVQQQYSMYNTYFMLISTYIYYWNSRKNLSIILDYPIKLKKNR